MLLIIFVLNMIVILLGPNYEPKDEEVCLMENGI